MIPIQESKIALEIIKIDEDVLKGQSNKVVNIIGKQRELLRWFKERNDFFENVV